MQCRAAALCGPWDFQGGVNPTTVNSNAYLVCLLRGGRSTLAGLWGVPAITMPRLNQQGGSLCVAGG